MKKTIEKVRDYMDSHEVPDFTKALVETQISMLASEQITEQVFKINVSVMLDINVMDL